MEKHRRTQYSEASVTNSAKMIFPLKTTSLLFMYFLLSLSPVESGSEAEIIKALEETQQEVAWKYIPLSGPSIDKSYSKNITAQIGKTAVLNCRIKYLGGKTVSWMRARDLHLLTVGRFTYTSDERFCAVHQTGSDDWLLKIHYAQERDTGAYECQVSTTPPVSTSVWLTVVAEPQTQVLGGPDLYINSGSTINLTCVVSHSDDPPPYIFWYHQSELLSYDSPRGGITVVTEHGPSSSSRLLIQRATSDDAGQYSCRPANAEPHQINVHIIPSEYEHPAAIHHKNGTNFGLSIHGRSPTHYSLILSCILALLSFFPNFLLFCGSNRYSKHHQHPRRTSMSSNEAMESFSVTSKGVSEVVASGTVTYRRQFTETEEPVTSSQPLFSPALLQHQGRSIRKSWSHMFWNLGGDYKYTREEEASFTIHTETALRAICFPQSHIYRFEFPLRILHSVIVLSQDGIHYIHHSVISTLLISYIPKS